MYPNLYYFFKDVFGIGLPFLKALNTFGFFMMLSFFAAAWLLTKELKRKQKQGCFTCQETTITTGEAPSIRKVLPSFFWGMLMGYKIGGLILTPGAADAAQAYLLSVKGSFLAALITGVGLAASKWLAIDSLKQPVPENKTIQLWPAQRVANMAYIAAIAGLIGAKVFDNLENWDRFIKNPVNNLFSASGLTFYGGLIFATIALYLYAKKIKLRFILLCDAVAPALMLAYCIGRMGCQVAGDGDWGIINSAYLSMADGRAVPSTPGTLDTAKAMFGYLYTTGSNTEPQAKAVKAPAGLPVWTVAYSYPHNVLKEGTPTFKCSFGEYCNHLPIPVFPTPLYEVVMALLLFIVLWALRKRFITGRLFALYLFLNGAERMLIEQIRVNTTYTILGFHPTQAEIIAALLMIAGIALWIYAPKLHEGETA